MAPLNKLKTFALAISLSLLAACTTLNQDSDVQYTGPHQNTVMITNLAKNHGGTGIVLRSTQDSSLILTNSHVCGVVEEGGLVRGSAGSFMVTAYKRSEKNDLCLIKVDADMKANTKIAEVAPEPYSARVSVSGHPALMPNIITHGHLSGREMIPIMVGVKPCTPEDADDPAKGMACVFLGGLPIVKEFDSVLVSATIMPGSSGSAVYNSKNELIGVVFAGSGELGYGWTVPYQSVTDFLFKEAKTLKYKLPTNTLDLFGSSGRSSSNSLDAFSERLHDVCSSDNKTKIKTLCELGKSDVTWYK